MSPIHICRYSLKRILLPLTLSSSIIRYVIDNPNTIQLLFLRV